ncbi:MAG: phosphoenolpyruvate--protein phosphotransferase [Phycisphaerales bacterium]|nr:phosphoenolpyruvate--protein phosphotransferase [Phycisphaerales bacterium]
MDVVKGIAVSPGVAIGRAFVLGEADEHVPHRVVAAEEVGHQLERFERAVAESITDLQQLRERTARELGAEPAKIFEFHIGLLHDTSLLTPIRQEIEREHVTAEWAVSSRFKALASQFKGMGNEVFRQKANDVLDLDRRVLGRLQGATESRLAQLTEPVIVFAHELTPSQAALLDPAKVIGFATDAGGRTSHTSIVARAIGIPAVAGCQRLTHLLEEGDSVIVDGDNGVVIVAPNDEALERYSRQRRSMESFLKSLREVADLPAVTRDGTKVTLLGNIEFPREIESVLANGGEGVGLYRTEYLYLASDTEPSEEDHFNAYRKAIELLDGRTLTIRTLDLGADKYTQLRAEEPERNPFLGCRSIRYCLQNLPMFKTQLRAILRASVLGPIKVMFPLISTMMELRQTRLILNDVMEELDEDGVPFDRRMPIGMMIEVPSAALMARVFAHEVQFFSIGTNDLIQYTLAVDRGNERVANLYTGAHPAVLQLIKSVIRVARREGTELSICGEIAGEALYTMLLIGMGLRTLSLVPSQIPHVKRVIRSVDIPLCERLARKVGSFDSERQVLSCLRDELRKVVPEALGGIAGD